MKKVQILVIVFALCIAGVAHAQQQVSKSEATNAAINALYNKADVLNRSSNTEIDTIHSFSNSRSNVLLYEVVFKNRAAILLSGSKSCLPVLGYFIKPENDIKAIFDTDNLSVPPGLHALIEGFVREIEYVFSQNNIELYYENEWDRLQQSDLSRGDPPTTINVAPLLTTRWGQQWSNDGDCPAYNYYVTKQNSNQCGDENCDDLCPVGCTAVAMGQIMKKWNYPVYLSSKIQQYDWCNMEDRLYYYGNPDYEKQRNAIARLLKDCADNANSNYCIANCNTSALPNAAKNALVDDFGYSNDAKFRLQSSHNNTTWRGYIKTDLDNGRPVLYTIIGWIFNSHTLVCDGYGSDNLFHFNWGWGNSSYSDLDCWFALNALGEVEPGYGMRTHEAVFQIYPSTNENYCNYTLSLDDHFAAGGTHQNVPQTYMKLESASETSSSAWRTIQSGQSAEYVAHETIILKPGFKAEAGSHFVARIDPCPGCNSAKVTVKRSDNGVEIEEELYIAVGDQEEKQSSLGEESKIVGDEPQVYPNPTTGLLTIDAKNNNSRIQMIELYNTQGTKMFTFSGNDGSFQEIEISHLPSQMYILKIQVNGQIFTKKLILQK